MDETLTLLLLSIAMLIGCYLTGLIPLVFTLSGEKLQLASVLGAGILVGTALAVIVPEGVHTLYSSYLISLEQQSHSGLHSIVTEAKVSETTIKAKEHLFHQPMPTHSSIGIALVLGFVFMLIIDQIGSSHSKLQSSDAENGVRQERYKITATLGLVVHAAADGIALGAAATTSHTDIEMIVFFAIMLHKGPAAFGLVTFLLHEGLDRTRIRKHLLVFALAAPLLAIVTYFGISTSTKQALTAYNATGLAMLFSAGTFLYVATVHVLPEVTQRSHMHVAAGTEPLMAESKGFRKSELVALIVGALLPLLLTVGHHH